MVFIEKETPLSLALLNDRFDRAERIAYGRAERFKDGCYSRKGLRAVLA